MKVTRNFCKGITVKGKPCPYRTKDNSEFCGHHKLNSSSPREKEQQKVKTFLKKHSKEVIAFLGGTVIDPVASDIYDFIKDRLKLVHLVPPIPEISELEYLSRDWTENRSEKSLLALVSYIKLGMSKDEVQGILGEGRPNCQIGKPLPLSVRKFDFRLSYWAKATNNHTVNVQVCFPSKIIFREPIDIRDLIVDKLEIGTVDRIEASKYNEEYSKRALHYIFETYEFYSKFDVNSSRETRYIMFEEEIAEELKRLRNELESR